MSIYVANFQWGPKQEGGIFMTIEKHEVTVETKIFTQEEVNEIVKKRLARERKKSAELIRQLSDYIQVISEGGE